MRKTLALFALLALLALDAVWAFDLQARRQELLQRAEAIRFDEERTAAERLQSFIDLFFEYTLLVSPELGTFIGHPEGHDRWSDSSLAAIAWQRADTRAALELLRAIPRQELGGTDLLNYDLLTRDLEAIVAGQRFPGEYLAISQMSGVHQNVPRVLARNPARTAADYQDILSRLRGVPTLIDDTIARLQEGLKAGVTPPRVTLRHLPQQVANLLVEDPFASPYLEPFTRIPDTVAAPESERLRREAAALFTQEITPALRRLHDFLDTTYLPGARETVAMRDLPDGEAWYAHRVREMTTTDRTPEEIHQIGLAEVRRIRGEMDRVIAGTGFEGTFEQFAHFLRTDPRFFHSSAEELLAEYRDISKRADPELVRLFGRLPRLPYGVRAVPAEFERSQTTAYYEPGSLEGGQPAYFFANTYDLSSRPKWEMEALTLHEAVPGHHLQIALAQEQEELPWFRRFGGYTAFSEGWGLYAESLGEEMGFYQDPYSKFGQLTYEMWRAIRLVVDTGMHHLGWSRQQAIDYFLANSAKTEHDVVVEVDRYIVWPGQALAYKTGELAIKELRAAAEGQLGDRFDIRAFHDVVLGNGALPLAVLETQVRDWIATQGDEPGE